MIWKILGSAVTLLVCGLIFGFVLLVFISLYIMNDRIMNDDDTQD